MRRRRSKEGPYQSTTEHNYRSCQQLHHALCLRHYFIIYHRGCYPSQQQFTPSHRSLIPSYQLEAGNKFLGPNASSYPAFYPLQRFRLGFTAHLGLFKG